MARTLVEARGTIVESADGGLAVHYITPGVGSSGYYSPKVLSEAAGADLFPAGMHLYIDHPSQSDRSNRPERSVRDIGGVSTSPGVWNEAAQAVEANIKILEAHSWLKDPDLRTAIGLSIRASGSVSEGEVEGKKMPIVESLDEVMSVDFVTHAGRGGRFLEAAMLDAYGASPDDSSGVSADVTESPIVRAGTDVTTEGETVPPTDAELAEATTARDAAKAEAETLKAELASLKESAKTREVQTSAREIATAHLAESKTPTAMLDRIVSQVSASPKRTEAGDLDESALKTETDRLKTAEVAYLAQFQTSPTMTGGGQTGTVQESTDRKVNAWGRPIVKES